MRIYKTYFDKKDTPFRKDYNPKRKYDVDWFHLPYKSFFNHKVVKIKLFGIFTIYERKELTDDTQTSR